MHLYVFGNGNVSFSDFSREYQAPLSALRDREVTRFIVCDFRGADTLAMEYLKTVAKNVIVYHIGERPRYLPDRYRTKVSAWEVVGGFGSDSERDAAAIQSCTHFLAYDANSTPERKSGTARNIERCLALGKTRVQAP